MHNRFRYVWQHFQSLYRVPAGLQVAYGQEAPGQVVVKPCRGDFFDRQDPWPQDIAWREWKGQPLPFLFTRDQAAPLLSTENGRPTIHYDIMAAAFYFLSGWQEYHAPDRDSFGRFPYTSSLQYKLGIITRPVVNYYFDILKIAIEQATGQPLAWRLKPDAAFTVCLTHDIDNTESAWKAQGKQALQQGRLVDCCKLALDRLTGRHAWFNWTDIARQVRTAGASSTFFFLCRHQPYRGIRNADYDIEKPRYQSAVRALQAAGAEIAIHGSPGAATDAGLLAREQAKLPVPVLGNRFHYLSFEPRRTPALLDAAGMAYDSTLGFAEHFGFRHSYCFPFRLYNFGENKPYDFLEIPLVLMDATLHHPRYLQLTAEEVLPALGPVLEELTRFKGCFTLLWHNENFTDHYPHHGGTVFRQLLAGLLARQVAFSTAAGLWQHFAPLLRES